MLGLLFSLDLTIVRDTWRVLLASMAYGLVIIVSAGTLVLALSSLSRNSRHVALFWLVLWVVSGVFSSVLQYSDQMQRRQSRYRTQMAEQPFRPLPRRGGGRMARQPAPPGRCHRRCDGADRRPFLGRDRGFQNRLEAAHLLYSQPVADREPTARHRRMPGKLAELIAYPQERNRYLATHLGPQYPWYWSAVVLAGLFGISACILSLSIRSLDRLR